MSLKDDIFDVEHALEGKPELEAFKKIMLVFYKMETTLAGAQIKLKVISEFKKLLKE